VILSHPKSFESTRALVQKMLSTPCPAAWVSAPLHCLGEDGLFIILARFFLADRHGRVRLPWSANPVGDDRGHEKQERRRDRSKGEVEDMKRIVIGESGAGPSAGIQPLRIVAIFI
jgi:hypothetical protein